MAAKGNVRIGLPVEVWQTIYALLGGEIGRIQSQAVMNDAPVSGGGYATAIRVVRNAQDRIEDAIRGTAEESEVA